MCAQPLKFAAFCVESFGSKRQISLPVSGSSAITWLCGVHTYSMPLTFSGVFSAVVSPGSFGPGRSPVR
ncbi:hypothetical protein D3C80_1581690 [compost metagenome]